MTKTRFDYFQNLRKTHPDLYWNSRTQRAMLHEAKLLGNAFYTQTEYHQKDVRHDQRHIH